MTEKIMTLNDIDEHEINVFVDAVVQYFLQITGQKAEVRAAYLAAGETLPPTSEFTGVIKISGDYRGCIYFSADRFLLSRLLLAMNETKHTDDQLLDAVGEIANTLAGNARRHFGEKMEVSIPLTMHGTEAKSLQHMVRARPYVIMVRWKQYEASMIVDIRHDKQ
ncbi:MAG: chemotaxis protein CheX [Burkholderiales bacterium]|jgi:chemotaxis protein CheX|nr:chemotaxis protein CheX [Burkholderiales bacterium]